MNPDVPTLLRRFVVWEATAVLRHDLRNKLASVRNAAFYLRRRVEREAAALIAKDPRITTFFDLTGTELDGAEAILADRLPRLPEPVIASIDLDQAIADALRHVNTPSGVMVEHRTSGRHGRADHGELAVAILCLVENAVESGATTVTITTVGDVVEVVDDGPGLDAETELRAFEPFFSTRPGHLGLGLAIVKRVVARARAQLSLGRVADRTRAAIALSGDVGAG